MSEVYFISDLHLGHDNVVKFRPQFKTVEEHDKFVIDEILKVVGKRGTLYILGDVCLKTTSFHYIQALSEAIKAIVIILGNHDTERSSAPTLEHYRSIPNLTVHGLWKYKEFYLSHCPIHPEHLRGKYNIHGHTHEVSIDDPRYLNVSCEPLNYKPISLTQIRGQNNAKKQINQTIHTS